MQWNNKHYHCCKALSYLLRHGSPEKLHFRNDAFVKLADVLSQPELADFQWRDILFVIRSNIKQRFFLGSTHRKIAIEALKSDAFSYLANDSFYKIPTDGYYNLQLSKIERWRPYRRLGDAKNLLHLNVKQANQYSLVDKQDSIHSSQSDDEDAKDEQETDILDTSSPTSALKSIDQDVNLLFNKNINCGDHKNVTQISPNQKQNYTQSFSRLDLVLMENVQFSQVRLLCQFYNIPLGHVRLSPSVWAIQRIKTPISSNFVTAPDMHYLDLASAALDRVKPPDSSYSERINYYQSNSLCRSIYIRAAQGHSLESSLIDRNLIFKQIVNADELPNCIHGTSLINLISILKNKKLKCMQRMHIHFASGLPDSVNVISGIRKSSEIAIYINVQQCIKDKIKFFLSSNGVILSSGINGVIPIKYFSQILRLAYN